MFTSSLERSIVNPSPFSFLIAANAAAKLFPTSSDCLITLEKGVLAFSVILLTSVLNLDNCEEAPLMF